MKISKTVATLSILQTILLASSPLAPSNLVLKAESANSVLLSWTDNSNDELGFKIYRDNTLIKTVPANTNSFLDSGLTANTTYTYTVKSTDDTIDEPILSNIHISEILASNKNIKLDPDYYEFSDYIELRNYENRSVDISGYTISDNKNSWTIPSGTVIDANGYLLIWADEKDTKKIGLHTNFKLSSKKETVTLKDSSGNEIEKISYKKLPSNISVRSIDGKLAYMIPSPERSNQKVYTKLTRSDKPIFSKNSGFYNSSQSISLTAPNGSNIYYTLDGSTPTVNSKRYTSPINISATTVIKAISIESGKVASKVETNSYIVGFDTTLSVVSLSIDEKYLFDDYIGIYVEGKNGIPSKGCYHHMDDDPKNFNQDWERPVLIEYFDKNKENIFNLNADISISGQCSRYNRYGKRSFSIELSDKLDYKLYDDKPNLGKIKDFKIRTGDQGYKITDVLATKLVTSGNLDIDYQAYHAVQMFMNGEYWGVYNIREKKGKDYLKSNYPDIDTDSIDIIAHVSAGDVVKRGNKIAFNKLVDFLDTHDLSSDTAYQELITMIDIDNYIDYMSVMIYSANDDWIYNNTRWWAERSDGGKWRWMLDDLDSGFQDPNHDTFDLARRTSTFMSKLFNKLLENSTFKQTFKSRFNSLLDTTFAKNNVLALIDELSDEKSQYMDLENSKWGINRDKFDDSIDQNRHFINNRVDYIRAKLNEL
jgi:hypothetical protein